jgi:hypothetical protein
VAVLQLDEAREFVVGAQAVLAVHDRALQRCVHRLEARCQALPQRRQACAEVGHEKGGSPTNFITFENAWIDPQRPHTESQVLRLATVGVSRNPVASIAPV